LNSGLYAFKTGFHKAGAVQLEATSPVHIVSIIFGVGGLVSYLHGLASNHDPPELRRNTGMSYWSLVFPFNFK
jgi:hypothetical protein